MDGAVGDGRREDVVDTAMLVDEREAVEIRADNRHLEVVAGAGPVLHGQLDGLRERVRELRANRLGVHAAMLDTEGYPAEVRLLRGLLLFKLGFWGGMLASAAVLKRAFPSRGDAESDELRLVAIMDGVAIKSTATAFRGGSVFSWFGGIALDLREATLAPDAHLEIGSLFGGVAVRVPPDWRIVSEVRALAGGVAVNAPAPDADEAPTLQLSGYSLLGGVAVGAKPSP